MKQSKGNNIKSPIEKPSGKAENKLMSQAVSGSTKETSGKQLLNSSKETSSKQLTSSSKQASSKQLASTSKGVSGANSLT